MFLDNLDTNTIFFVPNTTTLGIILRIILLSGHFFFITRELRRGAAYFQHTLSYPTNCQFSIFSLNASTAFFTLP